GRRSRVTNRPLTRPTIAPVASPARMPASMPCSRMTTAAASAAKATTEPIERSISPAGGVNTVGTAMMVVGVGCWAVLRRVAAGGKAVIAQDDREDGEDQQESQIDDIAAECGPDPVTSLLVGEVGREAAG